MPTPGKSAACSMKPQNCVTLELSAAVSHTGRPRLLPMAQRACLSSKVKVERGTSSDTGRIATVERLLAGLLASHLPPEVRSPRGWPAVETVR